MGFFSWLGGKIKSGCEKVVSAVKKNHELVVNVVKKSSKVINDVTKNIKDKVTNLWNKFTGKSTFREAEALYEKIISRYNARKKKFNQEVEYYTNSIEKSVVSINKSKKLIKKELFFETIKKLEKIKDISIEKDFKIEAYKAEILTFDSVRSKGELYKIDFNKNKFKTTIQAICTVGIYTRKKAKDTLYAVQEEERKIDAEIAKMDAEIIKLKAINMSLENVEVYFNKLIEIYRNLLVRLDNSVNYLLVRCLSFAHKLVDTQMSIRRLPLLQQKEVEAIITASLIMKEMTETQIVSLQNKNSVKKYNNDIKKQYENVKNISQVA